MARAPGASARLKLTASYAVFLMLAGTLLLAAVGAFLLRYVPLHQFVIDHPGATPHPGPGRRELMRDFIPTAAAALALLLVVGLAGGWWLAGRMLSPLTKITDATRKAADGSLSHRIGLSGRHDEFRELADAFDAMLTQLEAHVGEQRRFASNASHELRTPLAITKALLDAARNDPARADDDLLERLHAVNNRAIDLTESLLMLSRAELRVFAAEDVDLSLLAEQAAETLLPLAEKHHVSLETCGDVAPAVGSRTLLLQLTTNLVHNAIVHNHAGGSVCVTTRAVAGTAALTVENTGDELDDHSVAAFTEPFFRGEARIRTDHAGVGLGLAIVSALTRAHGGTLTLSPRRGGGLSVTVALPAPVT